MSAEHVTLEGLLAQTDAVAAAIGDGDWQRAAELEGERRRLLEAYVAAQARGHGGLEHLRGELTQLQQRNNQFIGVAHHHQRALLRESAIVKRSRDAAREYERHRGDGATTQTPVGRNP